MAVGRIEKSSSQAGTGKKNTTQHISTMIKENTVKTKVVSTECDDSKDGCGSKKTPFVDLILRGLTVEDLRISVLGVRLRESHPYSHLRREL